MKLYDISLNGSEILKNLSKDQYPICVFIANFTAIVNRNKEFLFDLEVIIDGINKRLD